VVETGCAERVAHVVAQRFVLAEHDAGEHGSPLTFDADEASNKSTAEPVGDTADSVARAHDAPLARAQKDVHAASAQERALVEIVAALGLSDLTEELELGALRRRPAGRQLQLHGLRNDSPSEAQDPRSDAHLVLRAACRAGHDDQCVAPSAHLTQENAAIERVEPRAPPPPPDEREGRREHDDSGRWAGNHGTRRDQGNAEGDDDHARAANGVGERQAADERPSKQVRPPVQKCARHGATSSVSCSSRAGPIPGIASSSRTELNAPCFSR
jgi:hypothetical protein